MYRLGLWSHLCLCIYFCLCSLSQYRDRLMLCLHIYSIFLPAKKITHALPNNNLHPLKFWGWKYFSFSRFLFLRISLVCPSSTQHPAVHRQKFLEFLHSVTCQIDDGNRCDDESQISFYKPASVCLFFSKIASLLISLCCKTLYQRYSQHRIQRVNVQHAK